MNYLVFVRDNLRFLLFGFALAFFSNFGQTFFIGLFGEEIRATFKLTEGDYGTLYSTATLISGFSVIWLGRLLDHLDLRTYATLVCIGFAVAAYSMSVVQSVVALGAALYGLRLFGQGLMGHASSTSMARYFDAHRGKAMSIASLGYPVGEAALPLLAGVMVAAVGWRETWSSISLVLVISAVPLAILLLRGHAERNRQLVQRETDSRADVNGQRSWTLREMIRDPRFYLVLPTVIAPGFIATGIFFHQSTLVAQKQWDAKWFAACFIGFAATQLPASLIAGPLVDRFGAVRLMKLYLLPLGVGLLALVLFDHPVAALAFMMFAGVTSGAGGTVVGAMWAEFYGVLHLGAIRALATALMVFSTAASPVTMGLLIDGGVSVAIIAAGCAGYVLVAAGIVAFAFRSSHASSTLRS